MYQVDDEKLAALDKLERHPKFHKRRKIDANIIKGALSKDESTPTGNEEAKSCWFYLFTKFKEEMLKLQFEEAYDSVGNPRHEYTVDTEYKDYVQSVPRQEIYDYISSQTVDDSKGWKNKMV